MRHCFVFAFLLIAAAVSFGQVKTPSPSAPKTPFAESQQALVVVTDDWQAIKGTARLFERADGRAGWKPAGPRVPVLVGRNGLAWAIDSAPERAAEFKKEGDGKAPAGLFPLTFVFGSAPKPEQLTFPYTKLEEYTECVDDPRSNHYNKLVDRMKVGIYDWKSSEKMLAVGEEYSLGVFVAYNSYPVVAGNGSCIFLHVWKDPDTPTSGCTAMARSDLERIVARLDAKKNPYLVQLTRDEYKNLRKAWDLPKLD